MAGISQKISPEQVFPLLGRNVVTEGYQGSSPTEFLILLRRYVVQARELSELAANSGMVIRVSNCDDARPLLRILGYRARPNCGDHATTLQTEDPERAFLSIDSGFPLPELELTLQGGKPFEYPYSSSEVPVLYAASDWTQASPKNFKENSRDLLDTMLNDRDVARLYWALSRMDTGTAQSLEQSVGLGKLLPAAAVLDFYGKELSISAGRVNVPGGRAAEETWKDLVGASPASPAAFIPKLLAKDKGWLAAYFDVLARARGVQLKYFTDPHRMKLFYAALRAPDPSVSATRGAFRPAPGLLFLVTRVKLRDGGEPVIPGGLEVWKEILLAHNANLRKWSRQIRSMNSPEQFMQLMFTLSRSAMDGGMLQMYMTISELDSRRPAGRRLTPETVRLLARKFEQFSDQYRIFSEFPELSDESIASFLDVAQSLNGTPMAMRANAFGTFQANIGIWQILARQGQIPNADINQSWQQTVKPFAALRSSAQLFDAGRNSLEALFRSSTGKAKGSQNEIIELLAGPPQKTAEGRQMHTEVADRIRSVLNDQELVSLDTLLALGDALADKERGKQPEDYLVALAGQTREFEMPRPIFTSGERTEWAAGIYNNHHTDLQMHTDLPKVLKLANASHSQLEEARGQLASFLRDTLVGLNYAYYEPPGAQALHNNPLFVRSHDFAGETIAGIESLWQAPALIGQGTPAGGGAHFVGSLADLPYALSEVEQDFISPDSVQALIWKEVTPELLTSAIVPRWWDISKTELHAIALYQQTGEELLAAAGKDEQLRSKVMAILAARMLPKRANQIDQTLREGHTSELLLEMMPADTFYLAAEFFENYPDQSGAWGSATQELAQLRQQHPEEVSWKRLSHDFGTPHPTMAQSYGLELLNIAPVPPFAGYSSRFLAETWDSPNLYWARLADEAGYSPVMLNHYVPELTRLMVQKIFATEFEDWPALLRAMHEAGADFKDGKLTSPARLSALQP
jgi:hypothetical protein